MEITIIENSDEVIVKIFGDIDICSASAIKDSIDRLIKKNKLFVVVDMKDATYIDSPGIGALLAGNSSLKKKSGYMKIINVEGSINHVFELTNLSSLIYIEQKKQF